uniref:Uncharacterized protein n=1 Tax=Manihot esculenta TaxID=3983 RepID=A0A2C9V9F9_MANES
MWEWDPFSYKFQLGFTSKLISCPLEEVSNRLFN